MMAGRPVFVSNLGDVSPEALATFEGLTSFTEIFGDTLCKKGLDGEILTGNTEELLGGKVICLIFDALWATGASTDANLEYLVKCYRTYKSRGLDFEVIFVSHDKTAEDFAELYGVMPWLALPFDALERRRLVTLRYKAYSGIPHKALVNVDSSIIALDVKALYEDEEGGNFPWLPKPPKPFSELLGNKFQSKSGEVALSDLVDKKIGLYFCRLSTAERPPQPLKLMAAYERLQDKFEVIVVDSSRTPGQGSWDPEPDLAVFENRFAALPFKFCIPFGDPRSLDLVHRFHLRVIGNTSPPLSDNALLMLADHQTGDVLNVNALTILEEEDETDAGVRFPWPARPIADFEGAEGKCLGWSWDTSRAMSLILFTDHVDAESRERAKAALEPIAREYMPRVNFDGEQHILFFMAGADPATKDIRELLHIPDDGVVLVMRVQPPPGADDDISDFFYSVPEQVTEQAIRDFITDPRGATRIQV
ncbi:hypothetical protein CYMTET_28586 [Cymbomonas tetramitiformis]|uniref:Thioredoxin-like fold domain-containing protein n=1 Tax=Cymbomonas tetramitiformis TaxID=36881 RepID=A0AAE0KW27_9CHLO|nr:hypothetical protein CYMTET_28586 [Cymbomonas tetramitiformis]